MQPTNLSVNKRFAIVLIYVLVQALSTLLSYVLMQLNIVTTISHLSLINFNVLFLATILIFLVIRKQLFNDFLIAQKSVKFVWTAFKFGFLAYLVMVVSSIALVLVFEEGVTSLNQAAIEMMAWSNPVLIFFTVVIFAPLVEEWVFRYALISHQEEFKWISLVASSFLFGFIHIMSSLLNGVYYELLFILVYGGLGFVLGLSYLKSKTIFMPILVHMLYNFVSYLVLLYA